MLGDLLDAAGVDDAVLGDARQVRRVRVAVGARNSASAAAPVYTEVSPDAGTVAE